MFIIVNDFFGIICWCVCKTSKTSIWVTFTIDFKIFTFPKHLLLESFFLNFCGGLPRSTFCWFVDNFFTQMNNCEATWRPIRGPMAPCGPTFQTPKTFLEQSWKWSGASGFQPPNFSHQKLNPGTPRPSICIDIFTFRMDLDKFLMDFRQFSHAQQENNHTHTHTQTKQKRPRRHRKKKH